MAQVKGHGYRLISKDPVQGQCKCGEEFTGATQSAAYAVFLEHKEAAATKALISSHFPYHPVYGDQELGEPMIKGWRPPKQGESGWETYMSM